MRTLLVDCYPDDWKPKVEGYVRLLEPHGEVAVVDYRELHHRPPADAVVFTGSPRMLTREGPDAGLLSFARDLDLPALGICFGHQLLGLATGAELGRREFYEGPGRVSVLLPEAELFRGMSEVLDVFESHAEYLVRESVERCGWQVSAESPDCAVEAMRHTGRPLHCVQFHPERSGDTGRRVVANFYRHVVEPAGAGELRD